MYLYGLLFHSVDSLECLLSHQAREVGIGIVAEMEGGKSRATEHSAEVRNTVNVQSEEHRHNSGAMSRCAHEADLVITKLQHVTVAKQHVGGKCYFFSPSVIRISTLEEVEVINAAVGFSTRQRDQLVRTTIVIVVTVRVDYILDMLKMANSVLFTFYHFEKVEKKSKKTHRARGNRG